MLSLLTSLSLGVARFIAIAVILLFNLPLFLSAQSPELYKSGYVITDNNDTISGYILLDRGNKLNHKVKFKTALTDPRVRSFEPAQAKGFRIVDKAELAGNSKNQLVPVASLFLTAAGTLQPAHFS